MKAVPTRDKLCGRLVKVGDEVSLESGDPVKASTQEAFSVIAKRVRYERNTNQVIAEAFEIRADLAPFAATE
jgi:hypothetical protein